MNSDWRLQRQSWEPNGVEKAAMSFLKQDRSEAVKNIYRALKRDHPTMPAAMKARIAARQGKPGKQRQGPPYKGPLTKKAEVSDERRTSTLPNLLGRLPKRFRWSVHNVIGHPASELLSQLGLHRWSELVHDRTTPSHERDHPTMPAAMKARIAARQGKPKKKRQGPPYKGPLTKQADVSESQGALFGGALGGAAGMAALPFLMRKRRDMIQDATRFSRMQQVLPSLTAVLAPTGKTQKILDAELLGQMAMQAPLMTGAAGAAVGSALASGGSEKKASTLAVDSIFSAFLDELTKMSR